MYAVIRFYARLMAGAYYHRSIEGGPVPAEGPLILVANHTGGLVDAALLLVHVPRPLHFLAKYTLFDMPGLGTLARGIGAIPIYRRKDNVDTALNEGAFAAIHATLARGEVVAIFPEGTSEGAAASEPELRKLKTGAARMALGAEAEAGFTLGLQILPVGVVYDDRDRFRSVVHVRIGTPFDVRGWEDAFDEDPRAAAEQLTGEIAARLSRITAPQGAREPDERGGGFGALVRALGIALFAIPALCASIVARALRPPPDKTVTTTLLAGTILCALWLAAIAILCLALLPTPAAWTVLALLLALCLALSTHWTRVDIETR